MCVLFFILVADAAAAVATAEAGADIFVINVVTFFFFTQFYGKKSSISIVTN